MGEIKQILMERDGMSPKEADTLIQQAEECLAAYCQVGEFEAAENICEEFFSLGVEYRTELESPYI